MKRFSLGLATISLTASLSAYAALPTTAAPFQVIIPNIGPGFEFNLTGLLVRPEVNDEDWGVVVNTIPDTQSFYSIKGVTPDYDGAIGVGLGYIFPCSGNDIRATWIHFFENNETNSVALNGFPQFIEPTFDTVFDIDSFDQGHGTETINYDAVDVDAGQFVDIGTRLQLRLFAGLRYAYIQREFDSGFFESATSNENFLNTQSTSQFNGIGPIFGVDSEFHLGNCFGLAAHLDGVLLVGDVDSSFNLSSPDGTTSTLTDVTTLTSDDIDRVVPGFDARLGLDWSHPIGQECWFTAELGWQWTQYIDVFDRATIFLPTAFESEGPVSINGMQRKSSDFGFDGLYLSLTLKI